MEEAEDQAILESLKELRAKGHGELRVVIIRGKMETIYETHIRKRSDLVKV